MTENFTCTKCGKKSLYVQFFKFEGKYYCRMCYAEKLREAEKR